MTERILTEEDCPRCIDERLIKIMGVLLVCPNCDIVLVDERTADSGVDGLDTLSLG